MLLTAGEGRASFRGQELNEICSADNIYGDGVCTGYVVGVYDAGKILDEATDKRQWEGGWTACVPSGEAGVRRGQLVEVVKKWLQEHPAHWHYYAAGLVAASFQEAFPCR